MFESRYNQNNTSIKNSIVLAFIKPKGCNIYVMGSAVIDRKSITNYTKELSTNLIVRINDDFKSYTKAKQKKFLVAYGAMNLWDPESSINYYSMFLKGESFKLNYIDNSNSERSLSIFAFERYKYDVRFFLDKFYKNNLS